METAREAVGDIDKRQQKGRALGPANAATELNYKQQSLTLENFPSSQLLKRHCCTIFSPGTSSVNFPWTEPPNIEKDPPTSGVTSAGLWLNAITRRGSVNTCTSAGTLC